MRLLVDTLTALMLVALLALVLFGQRQARVQDRNIDLARRALVDLQEQAIFHAAMGEAQVTRFGLPQTIDASWFSANLPRNMLFAPDQPWLDIAPEGDDSDHPPDPVITHHKQAGFWYNPNRGIFRARVPEQATEEETLDLYNQVNGLELTRLALDDSGSRGAKPVLWTDTGEPLRPSDRVHQPPASVNASDPAAQETTVVPAGL